MENMSNEEIIKKIEAWQKCDKVHPLTCCNNSEHRTLYPIQIENKVFLKCLDCDFKTDWIPETVLKLDLSDFKDLI